MNGVGQSWNKTKASLKRAFFKMMIAGWKIEFANYLIYWMIMHLVFNIWFVICWYWSGLISVVSRATWQLKALVDKDVVDLDEDIMKNIVILLVIDIKRVDVNCICWKAVAVGRKDNMKGIHKCNVNNVTRLMLAGSFTVLHKFVWRISCYQTSDLTASYQRLMHWFLMPNVYTI